MLREKTAGPSAKRQVAGRFQAACGASERRAVHAGTVADLGFEAIRRRTA
jgi:hypothetical protein